MNASKNTIKNGIGCLTNFLTLVFIVGTLPIMSLTANPIDYSDSIRKRSATVIIDIGKLSDIERSLILSKISHLESEQYWEKATINKGENISEYISNFYDYSEKDFPNTKDSLVKIVKESNKLKDNNVIQNTEIILPPFPKRPYEDADKTSITQVFKIGKGKNYFSRSSKIIQSGVKIKVKKVQDVQNISLYQIPDLTNEEVDIILNAIPDSTLEKLLYKHIYIGATTGMIDLISPLNVNNSKIPESKLGSNLLNQIGEIDTSKVGKLYLFDFYKRRNNECSHGETVMKVALNILQKNNLSYLKNKIIPVELDFFADKNKALKICEKYIENMGVSLRENLKPTMRFLRNLRPTIGKTQIPMFYLQALYHTYITDKNASIISSSFEAFGDGFRILPYSYYDDSYINLLSAVSNDSSIIEATLQTEPLVSFHEAYDKKGLILVGAEESPGVFKGMYSNKGSGISCLGLGHTKNCQDNLRFGTSFATPNVAAELLIAKSYWKTKGLKIDAIEARFRLLMSSKINSKYIGKFGSAGIPDLKKLLLLNGPYAINKNENIINLASLTGFIDVMDAQTNTIERYNLKRGSNGVCGIYTNEGSYFIFTESKLMWEKIEIKNIEISISISGKQSKITLDNFNSLFNEIILF